MDKTKVSKSRTTSGQVIEEILNDSFPEGKEPSIIERHLELAPKDIPDDAHRRPDFEDALRTGRELEILRMSLSVGNIYYSSDMPEDEYRYIDLQHILGSIINVEFRLSIIDLCPDIQVQMKQTRHKLADRYKEKFEEQDEEEDDLFIPLRAGDVGKLIESAVDWLYITTDEFSNALSFTISPDIRLDISAIIENPQTFFRDDVWQWMDDQPKSDFEQACRCLGFNSPTASVMLSLRAVEHVLGRWYEYDTGREIEARTWGQIIGELEDVYDIDDQPRILSNLNYLKERRNAVGHPEEIANLREAERMLYRIEGTISEIYTRMEGDKGDQDA